MPVIFSPAAAAMISAFLRASFTAAVSASVEASSVSDAENPMSFSVFAPAPNAMSIIFPTMSISVVRMAR